ncbi:PqqD family protein [Herbiconiux moechotypicola]|uniref:PqqD family protein n=1 Tax=Herbiconiux moechotypicola TaxID=637393 RepID=A0ABN3DR07_9MICO|nr:PqqD family protein [Herbiconiux moechotypicola]MCS5731498.1 PqqD family protein [Herbiconiux moechotypicola]
MTATDLIWRHSPDVAWTQSHDRVFLLNLGGPDELPSALEGSGSRIWLELNGKRSVAEVIEDLATSFDVDGAAIEDEVLEFVESLAVIGAVVPAGGAQSDRLP